MLLHFRGSNYNSSELVQLSVICETQLFGRIYLSVSTLAAETHSPWLLCMLPRAYLMTQRTSATGPRTRNVPSNVKNTK